MHMPSPTTAFSTEDAEFARASHLLETELGARPILSQPTDISRPIRTREHKAALVRAVSRSVHVRSLTNAFRVVKAAYPYLAQDGQCSDAAVTAACGPLFGDLTRYHPSTQVTFRREARRVLDSALFAAAIEGA